MMGGRCALGFSRLVRGSSPGAAVRSERSTVGMSEGANGCIALREREPKAVWFGMSWTKSSRWGLWFC